MDTIEQKLSHHDLYIQAMEEEQSKGIVGATKALLIPGRMFTLMGENNKMRKKFGLPSDYSMVLDAIKIEMTKFIGYVTAGSIAINSYL